MEVGLSAITFYLASASSPVVVTTMDLEPVSSSEGGEGVTVLGAAAVQAFRDVAWQKSKERDFENVELGVTRTKKKVPRRVIHFVSGETMEEYSTDEEDVDGLEKKDDLPNVDPKRLTWGPYLCFHMHRAATSTLSACDFLGKRIASVFGIRSPKHQYTIDEGYQMKREEEKEEDGMPEEVEKQHQQHQAGSTVQTDQPETAISSSFVNLSLEMEGDCEGITESKQNSVSVPP
ncbi:protein FAM177A1-like [Artibeus jamaicensis]|uniref:protein FAM177A1-like n=1 Tax=Artibeus jamaicensis TaxID=9417 RepID=UPI00235AC5EB|nr:protein FAM177A1-like [Artibeus jamaicensis]